MEGLESADYPEDDFRCDLLAGLACAQVTGCPTQCSSNPSCSFVTFWLSSEKFWIALCGHVECNSMECESYVHQNSIDLPTTYAINNFGAL